jgi:hypothetical protein
MKNKNINLYENFEGKMLVSHFSQLKYFKGQKHMYVALRCSSGDCFVCCIKNKSNAKSYYVIDGENKKVYVDVLLVGTTDEKFLEVEEALLTRKIL